MNKDPLQDNNRTLDIDYFLKLFKRNWVYFSASVGVALIIALCVNKFKVPIYRVACSILINEESRNVAGSSAQVFQELGIQEGEKNLANEFLVMKSYPIVENAIRPLNFEVSYFRHEFVKSIELYKSSPFLVVLNKEHPQPINLHFHLKFLTSGEVNIKAKGQNVDIYSYKTRETTQIIPDYEVDNKYKLSETITENDFQFKIIVNENFELEELSDEDYSFIINSEQGLIKSFQAKLIVEPPDLESTVAELSVETSVPEKDIDFLKSVTQTYLEKSITQKRHSSQKTIDYIDDQLSVVKDSLKIAEENLQQFRSTKQVLDISMQSQQVYDELRELKQQRAQIEIKQKYFEYIKSYFDDKREYSDLITPSAMGIDDPMLNNLIQELITLNSERNTFIENNQEKSPYLKKINIRIDNLRNMITENINYIEQTTKIAYDDLSGRIKGLNNRIRELPQTERELFGIERKFNVNDAIYTYLLEKKAEAEIAKASYQSDAEIIDPPSVKDYIAPKKKINYVLALLLGLGIPFLFFRTKDLLRKTIDEHQHLDNIENFPLLGKVYHNNKDTEAVVRAFPKSHISESLRKMSLNLGYFNKDSTNNVVAITSTISSEGKSFVSLNLATTLADNGYKCILVGYDLRKPRDYVTLGKNVGPGLSSYLSNQSTLDDIIIHTDKGNLDCVLAGTAPPNPFELIASSKTKDLISLLRETYDYVILDTPPIGVVSDGYVLLEQADLNIFIVRLKRTLKKELNEILKEMMTKKLRCGLVVNDIPLTRSKKYGYGYYEI